MMEHFQLLGRYLLSGITLIAAGFVKLVKLYIGCYVYLSSCTYRACVLVILNAIDKI